MEIKEFSQACENNKNPILGVLKRHFLNVSLVLEVGSGTGQHATYFADQLDWLVWQPTEVSERIGLLRDNCKFSSRNNLRSPSSLDIFESWSQIQFDAIFTANTLHIIPVSGIKALFSNIAPNVVSGFRVAIYGPFKYSGQYTSESNIAFDNWLRTQNANRGIRDFETVDKMAQDVGLNLIEDCAMPANNQLLVWGL